MANVLSLGDIAGRPPRFLEFQIPALGGAVRFREPSKAEADRRRKAFREALEEDPSGAAFEAQMVRLVLDLAADAAGARLFAEEGPGSFAESVGVQAARELIDAAQAACGWRDLEREKNGSAPTPSAAG